jgi:RimJ/RimL family protein N-acetyltransferase
VIRDRFASIDQCQNDDVIETSRLLLRALTPDHAEAIVAGERTGQSWAVDYPTPGDVRVAAFALAGNTAFATDSVPWGLFVIVEKSSCLLIGGIGFESSPDERGEVEIGYGISDSYQEASLLKQCARCVNLPSEGPWWSSPKPTERTWRANAFSKNVDSVQRT